MKRFWSLKKVCLALTTLALPLFASAAEAPNTVPGWTFDFSITGGRGSMPKTGKYRIYVNDDVDRYFQRGILGIQDGNGALNYSRISFDLGRLIFVGTDYSDVLQFKTSNSGDFVLGNGPNEQTGTFVAYGGNSPALLSRKVFHMVPQISSPPFSNGNFRLISYGDNVYITDLPGAGATAFFGSIKTNRSTTFFNFSADPKWGNGSIAFTFANATNGIYLSRGDIGGMQSGTFSMNAFVQPTFLTQPTNRTVLVGDDTTFAARVTGTVPLKFQWYKNGEAIEHATSTNYTIGFVEQTDAGEYWLTASNVAGVFHSTHVTLTTKCDFTVAPGQASFGPSGGTGEFTVTAVGTCQWTISNSIPWITIEHMTGTGFSTNTYTVAANTNDFPRSGFFTVGGKTFLVTQMGSMAPKTIAGTMFSFDETNSVYRTIFQFLRGTNVNPDLSYWWYRTEFPSTYSLAGSNSYVRLSADTGLISRISEDTNDLSATYHLEFNSPNSGVVTYQYSQYGEVFDEGSTSFNCISGKPDLNGDPFVDLVFQNTNGVMASWFFRGTTFLKSAPIRKGASPGPAWRAVAMNDFDNDGHADILFQEAPSGKIVIWFMNQTNFVRSAFVRNGTPPAPGWKAVTLADFDNDGKLDIVLQHENRTVMVWFMEGATYKTAAVLRNGMAAGVGWRLALAGDFNDDGQSDLVWQYTDGRMAVWYFVGVNYVGAGTIRNGTAAGAPWRLTGWADFNFDARNDLLFQHADGRLAVWYMNNTTYLGSTLLRGGTSAGTWKVFGPK